MKTVFDLFAGCGGLSTGLEMGGFTPLLVCELNKDAMASYLTNRHHNLADIPFKNRKELHFQDIHSLDKKGMAIVKRELISLGLLEENKHGTTLDLICGGPPCQGYSGIGHRRSYAVEKKDMPSNQLYIKMAKTIEYFRPRMFLFENVKGLLSARWTKDGSKGEIWSDIKTRFEKIKGYEVRWSLVRAKDYGVPQNRPRVLLVGIRKDIVNACPELDLFAHHEDAVQCGFLPAATGGAPSPVDLLSDLATPKIVSNLLSQQYPKPFSTHKYHCNPKTDIQYQLRTRPCGALMKKGSALTEQDYSKHGARVVEKFSFMLSNKGDIPPEFKTKKFAQRIIPKTWGPSGPSITATCLPDDYVHYSQPRILTVREWARLQLFPDWYVFCGKRTTGGIRRSGNPQEGIYDREAPKYTQIGNAVPVGLAAHLGRHFKAILEGENHALSSKH